ncbi:hypothetical protein Hamer_G024872 [Homarus americanus]|uniref:Uncharacterized protein n=1 Tax=Homarus americanus TaxID=6706 RepID=A0A8J5JZE7_HOMAM|nr:hypothetical protein Hamer_G024872 [Homarus americanus]
MRRDRKKGRVAIVGLHSSSETYWNSALLLLLLLLVRDPPGACQEPPPWNGLAALVRDSSRDNMYKVAGKKLLSLPERHKEVILPDHHRGRVNCGVALFCCFMTGR